MYQESQEQVTTVQNGAGGVGSISGAIIILGLVGFAHIWVVAGGAGVVLAFMLNPFLGIVALSIYLGVPGFLLKYVLT